MISAGTGSRLNVIGSSIAMVASGPIPGSTPIIVPAKTPMQQYIRFFSESATSKPRYRFGKSCWSSLMSHVSPPERERQPDAVDEDGPAAGDQHDRLDR